jgi:predicted dienelactone hydrolase
MRLRRILCSLGLLLSVLVLAAPGNVPVEAAPGPHGNVESLGEPGPYAVGFTSFILTDDSRPGAEGYSHRPIPVYVWYPVDRRSVDDDTPEAVYPLDMLGRSDLTSTSSEWEAMGYDRAYQEPPASRKGPFPLVMLSTGMGPHPWAHTSLGTRLASHGFIVAAPRHTGDQLFAWEPPSAHVAQTLWDRPRDISFVLTSLLERNRARGDLFHRTINPELVAAAGWSAGGYAALTLAGGDETVWDYGLADPYVSWDPPIPEDVPTGPTLPDPRIKALVLLDGANQMLRIKELKRVALPVLSLNEEWDALTTQMGPEMTTWQARQHAAFAGHPAYRVDIAGTNHHSFGDMCDGLNILDAKGVTLDASWGSSTDEVRGWMCAGVNAPAESRPIIARYMLAFLKTELLGQEGYRQVLTPGWALTRETKVEFFVTERRRPRPSDGEWPDASIYFAHQPGIQHPWPAKSANDRMPHGPEHRRR